MALIFCGYCEHHHKANRCPALPYCDYCEHHHEADFCPVLAELDSPDDSSSDFYPDYPDSPVSDVPSTVEDFEDPEEVIEIRRRHGVSRDCAFALSYIQTRRRCTEALMQMLIRADAVTDFDFDSVFRGDEEDELARAGILQTL